MKTRQQLYQPAKIYLAVGHSVKTEIRIEGALATPGDTTNARTLAEEAPT